MMLATRCSHCHTVFRLDQPSLNAAEGWVRCGRCSEIFNAIEGLFEPRSEVTGTDASSVAGDPTGGAKGDALDPDTVADVVEPADSIETAPASDAQIADAAYAEIVDAAHAAIAGRTPAAEAASLPSHHAASDPTSTRATPRVDDDETPDFRAARVSLFGPDSKVDDDEAAFEAYDTQIGKDGLERMSLWADTRSAPTRRRTRRFRPKAVAHRDDSDFELSEITVDVASAPMPLPTVEAVDHLIASNDRDTTFADYEPTSGFEISTRPAHRRRPTARLTLRVAAIVLGMGLVVQSMLHARETIAAHWPSTEPALQRLCAPFGCQVEAPRDLQALQVQSVSFREAGSAGLYNLSVVLFNRSELRVRMPSLDLRISDARGEVAARRVLTPAEMEQRERSIPPGSEATLQASMHIEQPNISGYEVTVFYP